MKIISIGEILWDVFPDRECLGGAPLNFAVHASRLGQEVLFVSAVGEDNRGEHALAQMAELGLSTEFVQTIPQRQTGIVTVQLSGAGEPEFTIHRPAAYDDLNLSDAAFGRLAAFEADWIYFGTLFQMYRAGMCAVQRLAHSSPGTKRFYDVNLRRESYTPALVRTLMDMADVVKLNEEEVKTVGEMFELKDSKVEEFCRYGARQFGWEAACVTRGANGCGVLLGGCYADVEGYPVEVVDTVGAGDAFAAAFLYGLAEGWSAQETGAFANRVGALVASRPGAIPAWTITECPALH